MQKAARVLAATRAVARAVVAAVAQVAAAILWSWRGGLRWRRLACRGRARSGVGRIHRTECKTEEGRAEAPRGGRPHITRMGRMEQLGAAVHPADRSPTPGSAR